MNHSELIKTFESCIHLLITNDFPLPLDNISKQIHLTHSNKYFGVCMIQRKNGKTTYIIGLNSNFVANGTNDAIINTIYHELLHTLPQTKGHDKTWKMYANKVYRLFGYNVCRLGGDKTSKDYDCLR